MVPGMCAQHKCGQTDPSGRSEGCCVDSRTRPIYIHSGGGVKPPSLVLLGVDQVSVVGPRTQAVGAEHYGDEVALRFRGSVMGMPAQRGSGLCSIEVDETGVKMRTALRRFNRAWERGNQLRRGLDTRVVDELLFRRR